MQKFKLGESSRHGYLDGGVVVVDEVVLDVLQGEGGLAHASVPQHHDAVPAADLDQTQQQTIILLLIQYLETKETYIGWRLRSRRKKETTMCTIYDLTKISIIHMVFNSFHKFLEKQAEAVFEVDSRNVNVGLLKMHWTIQKQNVTF